jgi:hypothetical protein
MDFRSTLIRATVLGLLILGVGSRLLMRVAAHMDGRAPAWTLEGSLAVVFYGGVAGAFSGLVYYILQRFVENSSLRTVAFLVICGLVSWRGVHGVAPMQQAMFMALAISYLVIIDVLGRRAQARRSSAHPDLVAAVPGSTA